MSQTMLTAAVVQMVSTQDVEENLAAAEALIASAAKQGARLVVLPENFAVLESPALRQVAEREASEPRIRPWLSEIAQVHGIWLVGGTIPLMCRPSGEEVPNGRVRAACCLYSDTGQLVARYDKIHLFDVQVGDRQGAYCESSRIEPGDQVVVASTPWGRLGLAVCYDLRFPELFLALAHEQCNLIAIPAAFTYTTGKAHWNTLLQARAIECQSIVLGANQGGVHSPARHTWGHSTVIDGWGTVQNQLMAGPGVVLAELDLAHLGDIRRKMPISSHRVL